MNHPIKSNLKLQKIDKIDNHKSKRISNSLIVIIISIGFVLNQYLISSIILIPLIISILFCGFLVRVGYKQLQSLKLNQIIRKEGPQDHKSKKSGIPTMGGIIIIPTVIVISNILSLVLNKQSNQLIAVSCITLGYMSIGFIDDWKSLKNKTNLGLTPKEKISLQIGVGICFLIWSGLNGWIDSSILLLGDSYINIGILIWPIGLFILIAESNATNLTDGLDGLASGCGSLVFTGLAIELILKGGPNDLSLAIFAISMAGGWLGFLIYNRYPAKIFMGDTGSLAIGCALSAIALLSNSLWSLLIMGGVFLAESLSVIIQVSIFKITKKLQGKGKRLFLMAPLHHHFELKGQKELSIVRNFWLLTLCLVAIGILLRPTN